ncbi:MAG: class I SAM-dependent methyltransferase [Planctomycetota bacterium]|nr:MAG: class I SAM-dependent methyltransferase [Planctomycetota bacterium]
MNAAAVSTPRHGARLPLLARAVLARLDRIDSGALCVRRGGTVHVFGRAAGAHPPAAIEVRDPRFWQAVALRGSIGAGEAYADGWWSSDDPAAVARLFVRNRAVLDGLDGRMAALARPLWRALHALRRNTLTGSRANIAAHYDLSNDFFALFLDDTLTYSCGLYERPGASLREASLAKIDRILDRLALAPSDHLLEIGSGWGALAERAAATRGCRVTTTTISRQQHAYAAQRFARAGLGGRVTLLDADYRRLEGRYDKLVSVEMIEAVGSAYLDEFFARCGALLAPRGRMVLQAITISDQHHDQALRSVDFIQRHIFPGCYIPSVAALASSVARTSDLRIVALEDIGPHYARTLADWRRNLRARWQEALALGHSERLLRLWEFYFAYCEGGFAERFLGTAQLVLERPLARAPAG